MQLPFLNKSKPQKNFFLSLLIKPYSVGAILFEEVNSKLFILATQEFETSKETSGLTPEELLAASDKAVSSIEGSVPEGTNLEKTIFSVPYSWVEDGKIKKDYLALLKKVCEDLGLTPVGYLVSIEAIVHFLQDQEGAPVSAVFLEVAKKKIFVYLVRASKIIEVYSSEIEENIVATVESLLKKIDSVDVLPSKIVFLSYKDAEDVQQEFLSHHWPKDIPFLHLPQVVVLEKGVENEATINGVAQQMELEVLQDVKMRQEEVSDEEKLEEAGSDEFGFAKEEDVASGKAVAKKVDKLEEPEETEEEPIEEEKEEEKLPEKPKKEKAKVTEESNIFPFKKDGEEEEQEEIEDKPVIKKREEADDEENEDKEEKRFSLPIALPVASLAFLKKIKLPKLKGLSLPVSPGGSAAKIKLAAILVGLAVVIIGVSFIYYNFILSARVTIFADKRAVDKSAPVSFSENPSDDQIKLDVLSEEVKGSDTKNSTGTKETGDKAKGEVTIYNKTENDKTFSKGAIVVGPNGLEFEMQSDVNVASTSSFSTTLSSAKVKVQASKFGKEYNLASGSNFTVKGASSSQFIAKNESAINGGTKKDITVVSKKDLDDLLSSVTDKLADQAMSQAKQGLSSNDEVLPAPLATDVTDKSYSKKEGDEAGSVGIAATIKYSIGKYGKDSLQKVVATLASGEVPGTYALQEGGSKIEVTDVKIHKDSASATLKVNAVYTPKIEVNKLSSTIKGKSVTDATRSLKGITGVTDVNINLSRQLPLFPKLLPANTHNITVEIKN